MLCRAEVSFPDSTCIPNSQLNYHDSDEGEFAIAVSRHVLHVSHQSALHESAAQAEPVQEVFDFKLSYRTSFLDPMQIIWYGLLWDANLLIHTCSDRRSGRDTMRKSMLSSK